MSTIERKSNQVFQRVLLAFISLVLIAVCVLGVVLAFSGPKLFAGTRPNNIGVHSGQLVPCPSTHNCVNSQSSDATHSIEPFSYDSSAQEAIADLKTVLKSFQRTKIITETNNYLYAEFTIPVVGFVDDVEFLLDEDAKVIHVRSSSRLGESDLGVNRRRIEAFRARLSELKSNTGSQST